VTDRLALPIIAVMSLVIVGVIAALLLGPGGGRPTTGVAALPALNAALNASSALLLGAGYVLIRRRRIAAHRACMLAAASASTAFLISYVVYHWLAGSRAFTGEGWMRAIYFPVLITHVVLAAGMVPFVLMTLYRALAGDFVRHARLARWTFPVWMYVSVTGVAVYWMLYRW
jgi:putative membrane protein